MNIKVSVIVPVFNAEPYIALCIESLLSQTIRECEFIFVNDGSTDRSTSIIERYRQLDSRIILLQQSNQGVSMARNKGLEAASGAYIGFVDADDFIEADMYKRLYDAANKDECDIVLSNFESEIEGNYVLTKYPFPVNALLNDDFIAQAVLPFFLKSDELNTACNKLYRKSLVMHSGIRFPRNVVLGEDGLFNMEAFSRAASLKYIDYTGYHYRETSGSATRDIIRKDYFHRALEVYRTEPPAYYKDLLEEEMIIHLKAIKLIHSVIAYVHIYLKPTNSLSVSKQIKYIRTMIECQEVKAALPLYKKEMELTLNRYQRLMLYFISIRSWMGLYCMTAYSRFRN
ncbi:glycosyltransferase [Bacillus sp. FJAT-28004]|uniref:glycosyltransferase n=1 Tax=Bacillus sp. FJAT-28004 TaxID=1679165 RepID=UPI0006B4915D|nr:glycosyltransferase [Bacillus sp. FJAT-28004]